MSPRLRHLSPGLLWSLLSGPCTSTLSPLQMMLPHSGLRAALRDLATGWPSGSISYHYHPGGSAVPTQASVLPPAHTRQVPTPLTVFRPQRSPSRTWCASPLPLPPAARKPLPEGGLLWWHFLKKHLPDLLVSFLVYFPAPLLFYISLHNLLVVTSHAYRSSPRSLATSPLQLGTWDSSRDNSRGAVQSG